MPATSPDPEHFVLLADRLIRDFQMETIRICNAADDADMRRHAIAAERIASNIRRYLASGLERDAPF